MNSVAASEQELESADSSVRDLSNDALIIRLIQTLNHLSRWLTPIHDQTVLEFSPRRSEPSALWTTISAALPSGPRSSACIASRCAAWAVEAAM